MSPGDYLSQAHENPSSAAFVSSTSSLRSKDRFSAVAFSSLVLKYNHQNKMAERVVVVTDRQGLYAFPYYLRRFFTKTYFTD